MWHRGITLSCILDKNYHLDFWYNHPYYVDGCRFFPILRGTYAANVCVYNKCRIHRYTYLLNYSCRAMRIASLGKYAVRGVIIDVA